MDYMNQMKIKIELNLNLGHEQYFLLPGPAPDLSLLLEAGQFPALSLRNSSPTPLCPASIDDTYLHICPVLFHILSSFSGKTEARSKQKQKRKQTNTEESGFWIAIKCRRN